MNRSISTGGKTTENLRTTLTAALAWPESEVGAYLDQGYPDYISGSKSLSRRSPTIAAKRTRSSVLTITETVCAMRRVSHAQPLVNPTSVSVH